MTKPFERLSRVGSIPARITGIRELARRVREFRLDCRQIDWDPGAHIDVEVSPGTVRQYSLCGDPCDESLVIAIQREDQGRGGSSAMHALDIGDVITIHAIRNTFPLLPADEYLFIAGGIGITPFLPMLRAVPAAMLLYGGRTLADMAYADELVAEFGDRVRLWPEDQFGRPPLAEAIGDLSAGGRVYACGPSGLLDAVAAACAAAPAVLLHVERFETSGIEVDTGGPPFQVECAASGVTLEVAPEATILDTVRAAGIRVLSSCQEGDCGTCQTVVIDGEPDHRDHYLTDAERAGGDLMMICVSRCRGRRLVLDL